MKKYTFLSDKLNDLNLSQTDMSVATGIPKDYISKSLRSVREWQAKEVPLIAKFLGYDLEEFIKYVAGEIDTTPKLSGSLSNIKLPYLNIEASAGNGVYLDVEYISSYIVLSEGRFEKYLKAVKRPVVIAVKGNFMNPLLQDGDLVIVDTDVNQLQEGSIYVVNINNEIFIKRLFKHPVSKDIICKSDNIAYPSFEVNQTDIIINAKLIMKVFEDIK